MRLLCAAILLLLARPAEAAEEVTRKIELTPVMQRDVTATLRALGYNCPLAKLAYFREANAYGNVIQVLCGPPDSDGIFKFSSFRFTYHPNDTLSIVPCSFLLCEVDD